MLAKVQPMQYSVLTAANLKNFEDWLLAMDPDNSKCKEVKALVEKYAFAFQDGSSQPVDMTLAPLEQRLALSHAGRELLASAQAHVDRFGSEFEFEEILTEVSQMTVDFVTAYSGDVRELDSFDEIWDRAQQIEQLALQVLKINSRPTKLKYFQSLQTQLNEQRESLWGCVLKKVISTLQKIWCVAQLKMLRKQFNMHI